MSKDVIATRELEYAEKGKETRYRLTVKVLRPYLLQKGQVSFEFAPGTSGCAVEFEVDDPRSFGLWRTDGDQLHD